MKRADIKTDVVYAWRRGKYGAAEKTTVSRTDTYFTRDRYTKSYVPTTHNRYVRGDYMSSPAGLLATVAGREELINPADLLCTWEEWEVRDAAETAARQAKRERQKQEDELLIAQAARLVDLWARSGLDNVNYVDKHAGSQRVSNDVLITLLSTFVDSLANTEQAKEA